MPKQRKNYSGDFKARVALEAIKGQRTINEIAHRYSVHPSQVTQWRKQALGHLQDGFSNGRARDQHDDEQLKADLYQQIGQLTVELEWLKKRTGVSG